MASNLNNYPSALIREHAGKREVAPVEIFNNTTKVVRDDLEKTIESGNRVSIAAACFSIYAYKELKTQLESCEELRFIFTSPTFGAEKSEKERREFYIQRLKREKSLYGTEFEVRLRNAQRVYNFWCKLPFGIHSVVKGEKPGVMFVLKNVNEHINIEKQNRLHPFYMDDDSVMTNFEQIFETYRAKTQRKVL